MVPKLYFHFSWTIWCLFHSLTRWNEQQVPAEMRLLSICDCQEVSHLVISPKRVWGQSKPRERRGEGERAILLYWIQKPTIVTIGLCCFAVCEGGSYPFELFRIGDNGWMLRTYVERPLWLMEEELHAGPAVWENTRPLLSLLTPQLMNAWMAECRYRPFRGQSLQEFTPAQTHPAMENTFA